MGIQIFIIICSVGEYSDRMESPMCAFTSAEAAEAEVMRLVQARDAFIQLCMEGDGFNTRAKEPKSSEAKEAFSAFLGRDWQGDPEWEFDLLDPENAEYVHGHLDSLVYRVATTRLKESN